MNVNIEKQEIVQQDDKFILSVSFNDNRNVIGLPSMTINELNEIKNKITSFVTSFNTDKIFIPTNEIDLTQEVNVIVADVLKRLEIHTAATILLLTEYDFGEPNLNKYCFDSTLIAANKFKDAGYYVYIIRAENKKYIVSYMVSKRDLFHYEKL